MKFFATILILSAVAAPSFVSAAGDVIINEIGAFEQSDYEWIEIYNRSAAPVDLTGWKFYEGETNHGLTAYQGDLIIEPGEYAIIAAKADKFKEKYPNFSGGVIDSSWSNLNESGESVGLKNANGDLVESFVYLAAPDFSLERANPNLDDYTSANWQEHQSGGTPGAQNSNYSDNSDQNASQNSSPQNSNQSSQSENISNNFSFSSPQSLIADAGQDIAGVAGTEIVFDGSKSTDSAGGGMSYLWNFGNGETASGKIVKYAYKYPGRYIVFLGVSSGSSSANAQIEANIYPAGIVVSEFVPNPAGSDEEGEWIEIANDSDSIADISDFQIGDGSDSIFKIPKNTFIAPRGFLIFARKATKISLNNDEDKVVLRYPGGEIADSVEYKGGAKEGFSAARTSDRRFLWTKNSTPGTANIFLNENNGKNKTSSAPAQKIVSENKAGDFRTFTVPNFSSVSGQSSGGLISFLPEVSAKTVDGYDESSLASANFSAGGGEKDDVSENKLKTNHAASFFDSLKNKTAAALILVPSIILLALAFVFRRKFWR